MHLSVHKLSDPAHPNLFKDAQGGDEFGKWHTYARAASLSCVLVRFTLCCFLVRFTFCCFLVRFTFRCFLVRLPFVAFLCVCLSL